MNSKVENEQKMAEVLQCVQLLKSEGAIVHCLEMCLPTDSAACGQAR